MTARLPKPGGDTGDWGTILNSFLEVAHNSDGSLKAGAVTAAGAGTYSKPAGGIPSSDLSSAVQSDLTLASNAVQLAGDLGGSVTDPTVSKLQGTSLNGSSPTDGQVLTYSSTANAWVPGTVSSTTVNDATTSSKGIIELAGDLGGTASSPTVLSTHLSSPLPLNQGGTGSTTQNFVDLSTNQTIAGTKTFTSTITGNISGNAATATTNANLTGDVTSTGNTTTVAKVQGISVSSTPPTTGQVLTATSTSASAWSTPSSAPVTSVAGRTGAIVLAESDITNLSTDLSNKAPLASPALTGIPTAPTATVGTNTTQLATTAFVTTAQPANATSSTPGLIQLSGDLGGTATSPTVAKLNGITAPSSAPSGAGQVLTSTSTTASAWSTPTTNASSIDGVTVTGTASNNATLIASSSSAAAWQGAPLTIAQGGTGSTSQNFVDLSSNQIAGGNKTWTGDQYFESGRPWFDVVAFGADPTGVSDSTTAFNNAIAAATGATAPATHIRFAKGPVFVPAGTYIIKSDLQFISVQGFQFIGAGDEAVQLKCSGNGFTNAAIYINGSDKGVWSGFTLIGDGTEGTSGTGTGGGIPNALWLTWDGGVAAQRSTSANVIQHISTRNLRWQTGVNISATGGAYQVDGTLLVDIIVGGGQAINSWTTSGFWQTGVQIGSGYFGNQYDHTLINVSVVSCYYAYYCNVSGYELFGAQPGANYCDFYFIEPNAQCSINGYQSQNSQIFMQGTATSVISQPISFRDCKFAQGSPNVAPPSNTPISFTGVWGGSVLFENVSIDTGTLYVPVINLGSTYAAPGLTYTFINLSMANTPSAGFTINTSSNAAPSVVVINFQQLQLSNSAPVANFPYWSFGGTSNMIPGLTSSVGEVAIPTTTTMSSTDYGLMHACTVSSAYTVTLPTPVGAKGQQIGVRVVPSSTQLLTVNSAAGNIDGASSRIMWAGESAILESDSTNWCKIAGKTIPMQGVMALASAFSVNSGSVLNVPLTHTYIDNTGLMCDPTTNQYITVKRANNYAVTARVAWASMPGTSPRNITVAYKNTSTPVAQDERYAISGGFPCISAIGTETFAGGDTCSLSAFQTSGSAVNANTGTTGAYGDGTLLSLVEIPSW